MYLSFFGLNEKPFSITPDPRYLYLSERHAEALAHLVYGVNEAGGFVQLTGEVGTGKTTTVRSLLGQIPKNAEVALILNPRMTAPEFLLTICEELGIGVGDAAQGSVKDLVDILNRYLLRAHADGRRVVLVVDEAQNLAPDVLEQVRLLTNLETPTQKLLQIILIGQPELRAMLDRPELRQLAQRITGRYHLAPLSEAESGAYVRHRLRVAGATTDIFTAGAMREVYRLSQGIPRVINMICDRALLGAYTQDRHRVTGTLARRAAGEVFGRRFAPAWLPWSVVTAGGLALMLTGLALWRYGVPVLTASKGPAVAPPAATPVAAVAATPAQPRPLALDDLLRASPAQTTTETAFAGLFSLWGASYMVGGEDPCTQAAQQGLDCLAQRGSFAQLRRFNRPAILVVNDTNGAAHQVVLAALGDEQARVDIGGQRREVTIADLARYWYGDFVLLWRPATPRVKDLSAGMSGAEVLWLRQGLERLAGREARSAFGPNDVFDGDLARLVEEFQRQHQLTVDGIAGVQTQVVLDAALATPGTPVLTQPVTRGG